MERKRERKRKEGMLVANGKEVDGGREAAKQSLMLQFHSIKYRPECKINTAKKFQHSTQKVNKLVDLKILINSLNDI